MAKPMERPPPLRFGAKALADAKAKPRQTLSRTGKQNVRGRPKPFPHSLKPKPEKKTSSTRTKLKSAQSSQARDPKPKETKGRPRRGLAMKTGKVSQTRSRTRSSDAAWVFDAKVSDEEHLQKHRGSKGYCVRCQFIQRPKLFESYSLHEGRSWMARGESRGKWGLGCKLCAEYSRCRPIDSVYSSTAPRFAKFAKFQFRPESAYRCRWQIEQHIGSGSHLLAIGKKRKRPDAGRSMPPAPQPLACSTIDSTDMPFVTSEEDFGRPAKNTAF